MARVAQRAHRYWRSFRAIDIRWVLLTFAVSCVLSVGLLRRNNLRMVMLRNTVVVADEQNVGIEEALQKLRAYVAKHMNTNLNPPVQLVHRYNAAVAAAEQSAATSSGNGALYAEAEISCKSRAVPLTIIAQCIQDYVAARTTAGNPQPAVNVPKELYTYNFISPAWSPDLAGWSVVISVILGVLLVIKFAFDQAVLHLLRAMS